MTHTKVKNSLPSQVIKDQQSTEGRKEGRRKGEQTGWNLSSSDQPPVSGQKQLFQRKDIENVYLKKQKQKQME